MHHVLADKFQGSTNSHFPSVLPYTVNAATVSSVPMMRCSENKKLQNKKLLISCIADCVSALSFILMILAEEDARSPILNHAQNDEQTDTGISRILFYE